MSKSVDEILETVRNLPDSPSWKLTPFEKQLVGICRKLAGEIVNLRSELLAGQDGRDVLELYRAAVFVQATKKGPRFAGGNIAALQHAWTIDRSVRERGS